MLSSNNWAVRHSCNSAPRNIYLPAYYYRVTTQDGVLYRKLFNAAVIISNCFTALLIVFDAHCCSTYLGLFWWGCMYSKNIISSLAAHADCSNYHIWMLHLTFKGWDLWRFIWIQYICLCTNYNIFVYRNLIACLCIVYS